MHSMKPIVAPSLLAADFGHIAEQLALVEPVADWIHLDLMDGVFVPNISFGFPVLEAVARLWHKPMDVHLMITDPIRYVDRFAALGTFMMTVHVEATPDLPLAISEIHARGMKAGVALSPETPVTAIADVIADVDMVLIMTVRPGFGGQAFIEHSYDKIREARQLMAETGSTALIEVDGGVTFETAPLLLEAGVDVLVAGSAVFKHPDPVLAVQTLKAM